MHQTSVLPEISSGDAAGADVPQAAAALDIPGLFREHQHHLLRFVRRYLKNNADAEDVVQNTFVEAMRCASRFSGMSKPSTWLFGIALNLARNQVRRNCGDLFDLVDESFLEQIADDHADPAKVVELRQIASTVDALLDEFSPKIRLTFDAVLDGEITYKQAAEQLHIPIGTVRSRVSRVRAEVRLQLG
ncbi:RNA polymerase sigma factor [Collimonas humicola]|uniref:RNA polymerase sigma factor n=1 Tax=Collimonas humicola TaxID=2825886 RepID=UPI001B8CD07D|nr:RNA polymerase sigma factor [Collimonas humicola]